MPPEEAEIICLDSPERPLKRARQSRSSSPLEELPNLQAVLHAAARRKSRREKRSDEHHASVISMTSSAPDTSTSPPNVASPLLQQAERTAERPAEHIIEIIESDEEPVSEPLPPSTIATKTVAASIAPVLPHSGKMSTASPRCIPLRTQKHNSFVSISSAASEAKSIQLAKLLSMVNSSAAGQMSKNASKQKDTAGVLISASPLRENQLPRLHPSPAVEQVDSLAPSPAVDPKAPATVVTLDDLLENASQVCLSSEDEAEPNQTAAKNPLLGRTQGYLYPLAKVLPSKYLKQQTAVVAWNTTPVDLRTMSSTSLINADASAPSLATSTQTTMTLSNDLANSQGLPKTNTPPIKAKTTGSTVSYTGLTHSDFATITRKVLPALTASTVSYTSASAASKPARQPRPDLEDDSLTNEDEQHAPYLAIATSRKKQPASGSEIGSSKNKAVDKAQQAVAKAAEKAAKEAAKQAKLAEKLRQQSISSVNVLKTKKKDTAPEMIVRICKSLEKEAFWTHMQSLAEASGFECRLEHMPVQGLVRFFRKTKAVFNKEIGYWEPLPAVVVVEEPQLMIKMTAERLLELTKNAGSLVKHVASVKNVRPGARVFYLLEGVHAMLNKSRTARNRAFALKVRQDMDPAGNYAATSGKKKQTAALEIDDDALEDAMLDLQVLHGCLIVHSAKPVDTARELCTLTQDMSLIPYKNEAAKKAGFCVEAGQVKAGRDTHDTFEKMLTALWRVTPPMAEAIASKYTSMRKLHTALRSNPMALDGTTISNNVDGSFTARNIGAVTSRNIARVMTLTDPHADATS